MTGNTKSNKVIKISSVQSVNICPLNSSRFFAFKTTLRTNNRFAFVSTYPLVKSSIAYLFTFPTWMSLIFKKDCQLSIVTRFILFMSLLVFKGFTLFSQFLNKGLLVAFHSAVITRVHLRGRLKEVFTAIHTNYLQHMVIVATI